MSDVASERPMIVTVSIIESPNNRVAGSTPKSIVRTYVVHDDGWAYCLDKLSIISFGTGEDTPRNFSFGTGEDTPRNFSFGTGEDNQRPEGWQHRF